MVPDVLVRGRRVDGGVVHGSRKPNREKNVLGHESMHERTVLREKLRAVESLRRGRLRELDREDARTVPGGDDVTHTFAFFPEGAVTTPGEPSMLGGVEGEGR